MATEKQAEANRANAQHSTGPRSGEGKARSSANALKFGIFAAREVIRGEDPAKLQSLADSYIQRWTPRNNEELAQVKILIRCDWELDRLAIADSHLWEDAFQQVDGLDENRALGQAFSQKELTLSRVGRRQATLRHDYRSALHELERLAARPDLPPAPTSEEPSQTAESEAPTEELGSFCQMPPNPCLPVAAALRKHIDTVRQNPPAGTGLETLTLAQIAALRSQPLTPIPNPSPTRKVVVFQSICRVPPRNKGSGSWW